MMHLKQPVERDDAVRSTDYRGRSLADEQDADGVRLDTCIAAFFDRSAALNLTPAEQRALLHVRSGELKALRRQPVAELGLDLPTLQRRLDYALPLMERMLAAMTS